MPDSRDDAQRQADLDWLYSGRRPESEQTRMMDRAEQAELVRRAAQNRRHRADPRPAAQPPAQPTAQVSPGRPTAGRRAAAPTPPARTPPPPPAPTPKPRGGGRGRGRTPGTRSTRRSHPLRWTLAVLALIAIWLVGVPLLAFGQATRIADEPAGRRPGQQPGTAILIVGSDSRGNLTARERGQLGTGNAEGQRTDTMMILYTPPSGESALIGLPRDSYLPIPGHNKNKLNAAYAFGGAPLLMQTVEDATGLRMDGYAEIGFDGFVRVTDAVGGVRLCLKEPMQDKDSHTDLPAGCQTLTGVQALGYVRMRKADPQGDLGRMKRQREFLAALVKKAASPMSVINPVRYWTLNHSAADALRLGRSTGAGELIALTRGMMSISGGKGLTLSVPISSADTTTAAGSSVLWDQERAAEMFALLASGSTDGLDRYAR